MDFTNVAAWTPQLLATPVQDLTPSTPPAFAPNNPIFNELLAQTFDPAIFGTATALTSETLYVAKLLIPEPIATSKCAIEITGGSGMSFAAVALLALNGDELASTGDVHASWADGSLIKSWASPVVLAPGFVYAALLAAGTSPGVTGITSSSSAVSNVNTAPGAYRAASLAGQATLPASPVSLGSFAASAIVPWIGIF